MNTRLFFGFLFLSQIALAQATPSPTPTPAATPKAMPTPITSPTPAPTAETKKADENIYPQTEPPREAIPMSERDGGLRFAISPYYGLGSSIQADNISINTAGTGSWATGNFPTSNAPGVAVEIYATPMLGFGWSLGASWDFARNISGLNAQNNGTQVGSPFTSPQTSLTILDVYANAVYRFHSVYLPFGANISFPNLQGSTNNFGSTSISTGVGLQLGLGYIASHHFAFEFWLYEYAFTGNTNTATSSLRYNTLYLMNPEFRVRFSF